MTSGKEETRVCLHCGEKIKIKRDYHVQLSTKNRPISPDDEVNFHFQCWVDYFNKKVEAKSKAQVQFMQERALNVFNNPNLKAILSQIEGTEMALNMLRTPLLRDPVLYDPQLKEKLKEKLNNGKTRNNQRKQKK